MGTSTVSSILYQGPREFDQLDFECRRTYVCIDCDGSTHVANMKELQCVTPEDIRAAQTCWKSSGNFTAPDTAMIFHRSGQTISLALCIDGDGLKITDPAQDEWGGFGGIYELVKP